MSDPIHPASELSGELVLLVTALADREHAALGALCVERVRPMVEAFYGSLKLADDVEAILWGLAEDGVVDPDHAARVRETLEQEIGALYDDGETGYPMHVTKVLSTSLARVARRDWDADEYLVFHMEDAARSADLDRADEMTIEEARWALRAVRWICSLRPLTRAGLSGLAEEPPWQQRFLRENGRALSARNPVG